MWPQGKECRRGEPFLPRASRGARLAHTFILAKGDDFELLASRSVRIQLSFFLSFVLVRLGFELRATCKTGAQPLVPHFQSILLVFLKFF
jgi:hypothetical protein